MKTCEICGEEFFGVWCKKCGKSEKKPETNRTKENWLKCSMNWCPKPGTMASVAELTGIKPEIERRWYCQDHFFEFGR